MVPSFENGLYGKGFNAKSQLKPDGPNLTSAADLRKKRQGSRVWLKAFQYIKRRVNKTTLYVS